MGRGMQIAVLGAAVVGSVAGSLAALRWSGPARTSAPRSPRTSDSPPAPAHAGPPPAGASASASADPHAALATSMRAVLARFAEWSRDHAGAPCPDVASLGVPALDPWGHDLALTCTDQPADQRIGAISAGPNGTFGDDDDLPSWSLGPGVTSLVRGPRWTPAPGSLAAQPATRSPAGKDRKRSSTVGSRTSPAPSASSKHGPVTSPRMSPAGTGSAPTSPGATSPAGPPAATTTSPAVTTAPPAAPAPPPPKPPAPATDEGDGIPTRR